MVNSKTKNSKGFTLVEMAIVIALLSILATIAVPAWQNYTTNTKLKDAARQVAGDIMNTRHRAIAENTSVYRITFNTNNNSYTLSRTDSGATLWTKPLYAKDDGNAFQSVNFSGNSFINFQGRGTVSVGSIVLKNKLNSTATITVQLTGRTYVQFNLQK
jgi:prepilin-type N-terminal cleavage/methylation domain-containing protein